MERLVSEASLTDGDIGKILDGLSDAILPQYFAVVEILTKNAKYSVFVRNGFPKKGITGLGTRKC
jgi:hypothetical protein